VPAILRRDSSARAAKLSTHSLSRASWLRSTAVAISSCSSRSISSSGLLYRKGAGKGAAVPSAGVSSRVHLDGPGFASGRDGEVSPLGPKKECIVDWVLAFFAGDFVKEELSV